MPSLAASSSSWLPATGLVTHFPIDWILILVFAFVVVIDSFRAGSSRAAVFAVSLPLTSLLFTFIPQTVLLDKVSHALSNKPLQLGLFGVLFVIIFLFVYSITHSLGSSSRGMLQAVLSGLSASIVAVVMWIREPVLQFAWHFGSLPQLIFGAPFALFWLLGAYFALAFVRK